MKRIFLFLSGWTVLMTSCGDRGNNDQPAVINNVPAPANIGYTIVNIYPHDTASFTQGLEWHEGYLYEGTGLKGESRLMKVSLEDGRAVKQVALENNYFGEGITILNDKIYQLTWTERKIFVYDLKTLNRIGTFDWNYEGWGLTNDGKHLLISTGGNNIYFADPETLKILNTISVTSAYGPLGNLNELEYVNGKIFANVWGTDYIAIINPETGHVEGRMDFSNLLQKSGRHYEHAEVLNGIAYDAERNSFFITGKKWPALFEVKLNQ